MPKTYHMTAAASYLVLKKDNQVLLLRRCNTGFEDGNYSLPAGHLEQGESPAEALVREAAEEVGIVPENPRVVHVMHRKENPSNGGDEHFDFFFACEKWTGEVTNKEPHKCDDLRWAPLDDLPKNVIPYVAAALRHIREGVFYSER